MSVQQRKRAGRALAANAARQAAGHHGVERLETRILLTATLDAIPDQLISAGETLFVPMTGSTDQAGLTYSITSNDNGAVTAQIVPNETFLKLSVAGFGDMTLAMFGNLAPLTIAHITNLVNNNFYNNLIFHRVYPGFMIQTGSPSGDGLGGSGTGTVVNEIDPTDSIFTGDGQLAMANSGPDTNDSQFFITTGPHRSLDGTYTLFGQLVRGFDVQHNILNTPLGPGNSVDLPTLTRPVTPVTITSATIVNDTTDAVLKLSAPQGQVAHVTVHVDDGHGNTADRVITVTGNTTPTLTSVSTLPGGNRNIDFSTDYATLLAASNLADVDSGLPGGTPSFLITGVSPGTTLKVNGVAVTQSGTTIAPGDTATWTPPTGQSGTLPAFTVRGADNFSFSGTDVQVNVAVAANLPPTLSTISTLPGATTNKAFTISYATLLAASNAADPNGDTVSFRIESVDSGTLTKNGTPVTTGVTTLGPGESLVWHPAANALGTLPAFSVTGWDGAATSGSTVPVQVSVGPNLPPTLSTISTLPGATRNAAFTISFATLLAASNLADPNGDDLSFRIESVNSGTLTKNGTPVTTGVTTLGAGESLVWHPAAGASGAALSAFSVTGWDGLVTSGSTVPVLVSVAANSAPVLTSVSELTGAHVDSDFTISYATLLAASNLTDPNGDTVSFRIEGVTSGTLTKNNTPVTNGVTTLASGENLVWHPAAGAGGALSAFSVTGWDGTVTSGTPVSVQVAVSKPVLTSVSTLMNGIPNHDYTITYAQLFAAAPSASLTIAGTPLFKILSYTNGTLRKQNGVLVAGTVTVAPGESVTYFTIDSGLIDAFMMVVTDGVVDSSPPVQVRVQVETAPTLTTITTLNSGVQDTPYTITYDALLGKSDLTDVDTGQTASFRIESVSAGTTLTKNGTAVTAGSTLLGPGDSLVWTPPLHATGTLTAFTVKGWDGLAASSTAVAVKITVAARATVDGVPTQNFPDGKTLIVPLTGHTQGNDPLTYSATSSNPAIVPTILTGNTWIQMTIAGLGDMVFQLFNDFTPETVAHITALINAPTPFYNGLQFFRIQTGFVAQGGDPNNNGTGHSSLGNIDDEFNPNLIFSGTGQLAMANAGSDTGDSQFFITDGNQRFLDFNHTIFGQLVRGFDVFSQIMNRSSSDGTPTTQTVIQSISVIANPTDAVMLLKSNGASQTSTITVTATSQQGYTGQMSFTANSIQDNDPNNPSQIVDDPPFLGPIPDQIGLVNTPLKVTIPSVQINGGPVTYGYQVSNAGFQTSLAGNVLTVTPPAGFTGTASLFLGVARLGATTRGSRDSSNNGLYDTQVITILIPGILVFQNNARVFNTQNEVIDFGAQLKDAPGPTRTFTLTNESLQPVALSNLHLPPGFSAITPLPTTIAPGASATLVLRMDTDAIGGKAGTVTFNTSETGQPTFSFPISGTIGSNFVNNLYIKILGRGPDTDGLNYWNGLIRNQTMTPEQITAGFVNSEEYRRNRIQELYQAVLSRPADDGGMTSWLAFFTNGGTVEQMTAFFYGSQEFFDQHGDNNTQVVDAFYNTFLQRSADSGAAFWVNQLNTGTRRDQVALSLLQSVESRTHLVTGLYERYLSREPDSGGLAFWVDQIGQGKSETDLIITFLSSNEFFAA